MAAQTTTVRLPSDLFKRAKKLADKLNKTMSGLIADGLWNEVTQLEKRLREETGEKDREEEDKREKRRRAIRGEAKNPTETTTESAKKDTAEEDAPASDSEDALYLYHAKKIVEADDPVERRLLAREGIGAICQAQPLTAEPLEVERRMHDLVVKLRDGDVLSKATPPPPKPDEPPSFLEKFIKFATQTPTLNTDEKEETE